MPNFTSCHPYLFHTQNQPHLSPYFHLVSSPFPYANYTPLRPLHATHVASARRCLLQNKQAMTRSHTSTLPGVPSSPAMTTAPSLPTPSCADSTDRGPTSSHHLDHLYPHGDCSKFYLLDTASLSQKKITLAKLSPFPSKTLVGPYVRLYLGILARKQKLDKGHLRV